MRYIALAAVLVAFVFSSGCSSSYLNIVPDVLHSAGESFQTWVKACPQESWEEATDCLKKEWPKLAAQDLGRVSRLAKDYRDAAVAEKDYVACLVAESSRVVANVAHDVLLDYIFDPKSIVELPEIEIDFSACVKLKPEDWQGVVSEEAQAAVDKALKWMPGVVLAIETALMYSNLPCEDEMFGRAMTRWLAGYPKPIYDECVEPDGKVLVPAVFVPTCPLP